MNNRGVVWERETGISVQERPGREIGPTDIMIEVGASGLCGTDLHIAAGEYPFA